MTFAREPRIHPVAIPDLRPTQITVGMREVNAKRKQWRAHGAGAKADFLGAHLIPVVLGPGKSHYLIDHHHLARALHDEGVAEVAVTVVADLSGLEPGAFWVYLDNRSWMHLYDAKGERQDHRKLPKHVEGLIDDPFRSSPARCAAPVDLPKIRRPSVNFSGRIFCAGGSSASRLTRIPRRHSLKRCASPRVRTLPTSRAGAAPSPLDDAAHAGQREWLFRACGGHARRIPAVDACANRNENHHSYPADVRRGAACCSCLWTTALNIRPASNPGAIKCLKKHSAAV